MDASDLSFLVDYHRRANERILETAAKLSDEELRRPGAFDHEHALDNLFHIMDTTWSWRVFIETGEDVQDDPDGFPFETVEALRGFYDREHAALASYVGGASESELDEVLTWDGEDGPESFTRWQIVAHVINHGTQHRAELARYFTSLGSSPGDLDLTLI